jgi:pyruvate dehydrogenase E2 component (dihydrolipoamide acetyltransferase)
MSVSKVVLAKLSPTMEEGTIVKWSKKEGDPVKVGDVLAEIETDKANMEMEALAAGVLRKILVPAGGKAPVGALIGVVADPGDDISSLLASASAPAAAAAPPAAAPAAPPAPPTPAAPPSATPAPAASSAPSARPEAPAPAPSAPAPAAPAAPTPGRTGEERVKASPLARNMAAERNIPLESIAGSGPGGRVVKRDIETWKGGAAPSAAAAARPAPQPGIVAGQEIPVSSMRKAIAKRLAESKFTAPHYYVSMDVDMDAAMAMREQLIRAENTKLSYNDFVVKACARALTRWPMVNSSWAGDKIVTHGEVHVGVAVALPDGLITPVVRNADRKSVPAISQEIKELAGRAKDRKLRPEEFMGSTFTVSNLGMYDVTEFTAIINPPEACILAVGAVRKLPVVAADDSLRVGHRMRITLSSDHRVVDGALAAQFLQEVRRLLESPIGLLL